MEYTTLGGTGMTVSRLCVGCGGFGTSEWRDWVLDEPESREIIERALDLGITMFDTANMYSDGESECVLGNALDGYDRDRLVINTKAFWQMDPGDPNSGGLSRKAIERALSNSLDRLGLETVDLYQIHRWDPDTPIEETLRALSDAGRRGDVRYIGASSMWATQFSAALHASDALGLDRFVSMQNHYNLAYREEEREMLPLCAHEGIGVLPWSPLARGYLARPLDEIESTTRSRSENKIFTYPYREGGGREINERVEELAAGKGVSMAKIALSWLLSKDVVDAPVIGPTSVEHLEDAVAALDVSLSDSDVEYLEEPYEPVRVTGHPGLS